MSALLLLSTLTWTVDAHLCMGRTMDVAFFTKAETCGMGMLLDEGLENHCCDNETVVFVGQDDLKTSSIAVDLQERTFFVEHTPCYINLEGSALLPIVLNGYPPPENVGVIDRNILYETFLI